VEWSILLSIESFQVSDEQLWRRPAHGAGVRGIALEHITAVTKISKQHLIALEQEKFRLLPGGILSKGIVRGYAGAVAWMRSTGLSGS